MKMIKDYDGQLVECYTKKELIALGYAPCVSGEVKLGDMGVGGLPVAEGGHLLWSAMEIGEFGCPVCVFKGVMRKN